MSGPAYGSGFGSGGMTPGAGKTTPVGLAPAALDPLDKKVVCRAICVCAREPDSGARGQNLKQQCVSRNLRDVDRSLDWQSPYKSEVNYDMSQFPPSPIMRSANPLEAHPYLPAWIAKYWPGGADEYPAGTGAVRRPDVVIVKDGSQPPIQSNIKNIVEIKFPPQTKDVEQDEDYARIAGDENKVVTMGPGDCDCSDDDDGESPLRVAAEKLSELGRKLRHLVGAPPSVPGFGGAPVPPAPIPLP
ncbi:VRR-NUC domain-containing protein [Burkholderia pseudomallei]|uniref:VRR-NUC domain-containing protein n=1 Tax=Burkholderia pseudomallei TaxID=28450 RepID=UPI000F07FF60|nr:VRR-NUC domain-containing protein [Burkholderia pseudomallei]CAJ3079998.1 putative bacteriophage protein gp29 [Burkholderia pseudomallei]VCK80310.1 putative bacteriophage protein gp29 [Burkholderia pseudomallei]VCK83541.1 putative bacteriophage protein gp29 [Burkholderia pseudomallei]VCK91533.1 putative bacteriophage protein gp29 [Burkholderia pseudomallei]VCK96842.1 putative bacteriophage protein gp29 [Burkholderia pseudomallei]